MKNQQLYVPGEEMLENDVRDFNLDIGTTEQEIEIGQRQEDLEEEDVYDMFAELDLSEKVPEEFQLKKRIVPMKMQFLITVVMNWKMLHL